jgi:hypothetical protein
MTDFEDCSYLLRKVDDAPEPLRAPLREALPISGAEIMIYTPPCRANRFTHGPSVLTIMSDSWACIEHTVRGENAIVRSDFSRTMFIELTEVLLSGALRIHFEDGPVVRSVALAFNTVRENMYLDAVQRLLHGMNGIPPGPAVDRNEDLPVLEALPLKFRNSAWSAALSDEHVRTVTHWPATTVGYNKLFQIELAPEAMFLLGDHELIFVAEEKANGLLHVGRENKYGDVSTYLPLARLHEYRFVEGAGQLDRLELGIGCRSTTEKLLVEYPYSQRIPIQDIIERVFREKGEGTQRLMNAKPTG